MLICVDVTHKRRRRQNVAKLGYSSIVVGVALPWPSLRGNTMWEEGAATEGRPYNDAS